MNTLVRSCPLCGNEHSTGIHTQQFANHFAHTIAVCDLCGFIFVNKLPSKEFYDTYYQHMSKYDSNREEWFHAKIVKHLQKHISPQQSILDVGCATGHLLSLLKHHGYTNLMGIDPSVQSATIARDAYAVTVNTGNIYTYATTHRYDLVILSAVLEHLTDIRNAIQKATQLLTENGHLFICVPDASAFHKSVEEPYGEFSTEHINFFSPSSLYGFMNEYQNILMKTDDKAIYSLWKKDPLKKTINRYISLSAATLQSIQTYIDTLPEGLIVWGAGALTQRLLETTTLSTKVTMFVDKDKKLHNTKLHDVPVVSPDTLSRLSNPIFIVSYKFKKEIAREIQKKKLTNTVYSL